MPTIAVLFSVPLAFYGEDQKLHETQLVNHEFEHDLICRSLEEAKKAVNVTFSFATTDRLRSVVTLGCKILHYSGHSNADVLSFEDGAPLNSRDSPLPLT